MDNLIIKDIKTTNPLTPCHDFPLFYTWLNKPLEHLIDVSSATLTKEVVVLLEHTEDRIGKRRNSQSRN